MLLKVLWNDLYPKFTQVKITRTGTTQTGGKQGLRKNRYHCSYFSKPSLIILFCIVVLGFYIKLPRQIRLVKINPLKRNRKGLIHIVKHVRMHLELESSTDDVAELWGVTCAMWNWIMEILTYRPTHLWPRTFRPSDPRPLDLQTCRLLTCVFVLIHWC